MKKNQRIKIPTLPNSHTLEMLIRAKLLLEHAVSHSASASSIDNIIAVHGLDNSVECILRILCNHLQLEESIGKSVSNSDLSTLAGEVNKFLSQNYCKHLPYFQEIKTLRQVRNLAQHGALNPGADLQRHVYVSERFFLRTLKLIFGLSPNELCISSLVKNRDIKKSLKKAENELSEAGYLAAAIACRNAFENAVYLCRIRSEVHLSAVPAIADLPDNQFSLKRHFQVLSDELDLLKLGIDSCRYERFKEIVRHIPSGPADKEQGYIVMQRPWSENDARFCYGFVSDCVLRWQAEEADPLYPRKLDHKYDFKEKFGGIQLYERGQGCRYYEDNKEVWLFYVSRRVKDNLKKLKIGEVYLMETDIYKDSELETKISAQIKLTHLRNRIHSQVTSSSITH